MKKLSIKTIILFLAIFIGPKTIYGASIYSDDTAKLSYVGPTEVTSNETFTVNIQVSDIEGLPIIGIGGRVIYDTEYLEFISISGIKEPYPILYNEKYLIFSGFSMEAKGITETTNILTLTFKAKKEGTTNLSFFEPELSDYNSKIIKTIAIPYELTIKNNPTTTEEITKNIITESEEDIKEEITNIPETNNIIKETEKTINNIVNTTKNTPSNETKNIILEVKENNLNISAQKMTNFLTLFKNLIPNKNNTSYENKPILIKIGNIIETIFNITKEQ